MRLAINIAGEDNPGGLLLVLAAVFVFGCGVWKFATAKNEAEFKDSRNDIKIGGGCLLGLVVLWALYYWASH